MRSIYPGEVIREEYILPLGLIANALSLALRVPAPGINDVVRERLGIASDTALRLARYFNTTPQFWLNLQASFDPTARIVINAYQGQNLGKRLMREALMMTKNVANQVGSYGMYLDGEAAAIAFYQKLGFVLLDGNKAPDPSAMFLPLTKIP